MDTEKKIPTKPFTPIEQDKTGRLGLWVSLSLAAVTALGVLATAFYVDYQKHQTDTQHAQSISTASDTTPSAIPTSEAQAASIAAATSNQQSQGMTAPSDEGNETETAPPTTHPASDAATTHNAASTVAATTVATASSPANTILAEENAISAETNVIAQNGVVQFYFARGKADMAANTLEALKDTVDAVKAGKKAVIISHADVESNTTLTKERAFAVRSVLLAAGIPENRIEVREPKSSSGNGRLVKVILE